MHEDGGHSGGLLSPGSSPSYSTLATLAVSTVTIGVLLYKRYYVSSAQQARNAQQAAALREASRDALSRPSLDADPSRKRVRVLFGTQTGTAERFAKHIGAELRKHHGESTAVDVVDLENYRGAVQLAREKLVVLCVATYGDGEPTDNAADFFSWLNKEFEAVSAGEKQPYLQVRARMWPTRACKTLRPRGNGPVIACLQPLNQPCCVWI